MRFRVLGALEVLGGAGWVPVSAPRGRALLAVLLVRAAGVVSIDQLVCELWGDQPPKTAVTQIHGYVMRLRRTLGDGDGRLLVTAAPGYRLALGDRDVDLQEFVRLTGQGREALAAGRAERAAQLLGEALALWRGPALFDVPPTPLVAAEASRLDELRLAAWDARIEADLRRGRHAELIGELRRHVDEHPLREEPWRQLMLALYRSGRQTEALAEFQRLRRILIDEVGVEPGAAVRKVHQAILADDLPVEPAMATQPVPRQLPAAPRFIGRADELKQLDEVLDAESGPGAALVISAIAGTGGVGKTALAVHWGHQVAGRFPDGQLYVNLRGYDTGTPVPPAAVLAQFLHALGVPPDQIPHGIDGRAAQYRTLLADRRMLVLLDNASSPDQVRPLLPGSATCLTLITSRDDLRALTVTHGARGLRLDVLRHDDALALLADVLGADRAGADTGGLAELARLCGHLPLALRIAGANLAVHPQQTIAGHVAELRQGNLLGKLAVSGDRQAAVRAAFDLSYATLTEPARRLFRLLGMAPVPNFTAATAAALLDTATEDASATLDRLAAAHMIEPLVSNRFTFHDLVRLYASTLAGQEDPEPVQRDALTRLFDHYLRTASAAMDRYAPQGPARPGSSTVDFADRERATAWLDAERENLLAVADHAGRHGWPVHTIRLAETLFRYFDDRADWDPVLVLSGRALDVARTHNDLRAQAAILVNFGVTCRRIGRHPEALEHFQQSHAIARRLDDPATEARGVFNIALMHLVLGRWREAVDPLRWALELFERTGDRAGQARVLYNLGGHYRYTGRYREAIDCLGKALELARETGNPTIECRLLSGIGQVHLCLGRHDEAIEHCTAALALARRLSTPDDEVFAHNSLGMIYRSLGQCDRSLDHHQQALEIALRIRAGNEELETRCGLGETLRAAGRLDEALRQARIALAMATELRLTHDEAKARDCLAGIHAELGDHDHARNHWHRALAIYTELGDPEADRISQRLEAIGTP